MKNPKIIMILFGILAIIQLIIPVKMIYDQEDVLKHGVEFRFRTAPVDPVDAMRGRYVALQYEIEELETSYKEIYKKNSTVYLVLTTDSAGYAVIDKIEKSKPDSCNYLKSKISYTFLRDSKQIVRFELPFNRYYMEEAKAPQAEKIFQDFNRTSNELEAFAVVRVKDGKSVLSDLYIDAKPISSYFERKTSE